LLLCFSGYPVFSGIFSGHNELMPDRRAKTSIERRLAGQEFRFKTFKNGLVIIDTFNATFPGLVQFHLG
jgi:hypothetical protein